MNEPEHKRRLQINRPFIVQTLLGVDEVLDHLLSEEVFSKSVVEDIRCRTTQSSQIRSILDALDKRSSDKFDTFCSILDKTNNDLISAKLRDSVAPSSSLPPRAKALPPRRRVYSISDKDKEVFRKLHVEFVETMLDVESVVDSLMGQELMGEAHRSSIFQYRDRRQQVRHLMNILPKKGAAALPALLTALKTSGNDHLYEKIKKFSSP